MLFVTWSFLWFLTCLPDYVLAKATFNYEFLDTDNTILKLRCDGDCSTDTTVLTIVIYNATSMTQMAAVNSGHSPNAFKSSVQDASCFVAGGLFQGESCHLELIITNCDILTHLNFGCNISHSDIKGTISTASTPLKVERKETKDISQCLPVYAVIATGLFALFLMIALCGTVKLYLDAKRSHYKKEHDYCEPTALQGREHEDGVVGLINMADIDRRSQTEYIEPVTPRSSHYTSINNLYFNQLQEIADQEIADQEIADQEIADQTREELEEAKYETLMELETITRQQQTQQSQQQQK